MATDRTRSAILTAAERLYADRGFADVTLRADVEDVAQKMGLRVVRVVGVGSLAWANERVRTGLVSTWGEFAAEGLVGRPACELFARNGDRILAKIKARDFKQLAEV